MRWWHQIVYFVRRLDRKRAERELDEEIRTHLEMETRKNIEDGMASDDARYAAIRAFGNITLTKEDTREMWGFRSLDTLWRDLRYGVRILLKKPIFTIVVMLTLIIGIGANTAVFSIVNTLLLQPYPYIDTDGWIYIWERPLGSSEARQLSASAPNIRDWKQQSRSLSTIGAFMPWSYNVSSSGEAERVRATIISPDLFTAIGVSAAAGRLLIPDDSKSSERPVVISYGLWQRRFGGDPNLPGNKIVLNAVPHTVVGVAPPNFSFPPESRTDVWTAMPESMLMGKDRSQRGMGVAAKLKENASLKEAQTEMDLIADRIASQYPENKDYGVLLRMMREEMTEDFRTPLLALSGALVFVLILACINIANLQLAHWEARRKEISLRVALGAGRGTVIRQLFTESLIPVFIAGALGILLAPAGIKLLLSFIPPDEAPSLAVRVDRTVLLVSTLVVTLTAILSGLFPAIKASRLDLTRALVIGGAITNQTGISRRLRGAFLVAQLALTLVPLIGAGLMIQTLIGLQKVNPGFETDRRLTIAFSAPNARYPDPAALSTLAGRIREEVKQIPGVEKAALAQNIPFSPSIRWFQAISRQNPKSIKNPAELPLVFFTVAGPDYFESLQIPLKSGRTFADADARGAAPVIIINETLARRHFQGEDPIGKQLWAGHAEGLADSQPRTVVGVIGDVLMNTLEEEPQAAAYVPILQQEESVIVWRNMYLVVHCSTDPRVMLAAVRERIGKVDPELALTDILTMEERLAASLWRQRFTAGMLGALGLAAVVIAMIGILGITGYLVSQRTREIGIRMALGARRADIFRMIIGEGLLVVLAGIGLGLIGSIAMTRYISTLLYGVRPDDPATLAVLSLFLACMALLASIIPAYRATRVEPVVALRFE
jgi:putative ABC transport system permease protein